MKGEGFGKVILFGEHFVVHGLPAIAAGISNKITVKLEPSDKNKIITKDPIKTELTLQAVEIIEEELGANEKFKINMSGDLPTGGGLGSSAAFCVALTKAISKFYSKHITNEEVNSIAYKGEKVFHGNPSGIDNTAATYGGAILFQKGEEFKKIELKTPLNLVVGVTGKIGNTKDLVASVGELKKRYPELMDAIFNSASKLVFKALIALEEGNIRTLGELMSINHGLLSSLGVSSKENEELVYLFREAGALGAKLTGAGGGGSCIALAKDKKHAEEILSKIKKQGYKGFVTRVE